MCERFFRVSVRWIAILLVAGFATASMARAQACLDMQACNPANVNGILFVDGVLHKSLAATIDACPQTCWIIDNLPETLSLNPFANVGAKSVKVTLDEGRG